MPSHITENSIDLFSVLSQVEYGKPGELLQKENGMLRGLVEESADKENLYKIAMRVPT